MCKYVKIKKAVCILLYFISSVSLYAQTLQTPRIPESFFCRNSTNTNIEFLFDFNGAAFDASNEFIIELSDATGDFSSPTNVGRITGENTTFFDIVARFDLPVLSYGDSYRVRIVSTMPAMEGPSSPPFEAYYMTSESLILNGRDNVVLCGGVSQTVSVNEIDPIFNYVWYKDDVVIRGEVTSSLEISQPGRYYAAIDYGACTSSGVESNFIDVTSVSPTGLVINGDNTVEICANETYDLVASVDDTSFVYKWFRDGIQITGLPDYSPNYEAPVGNQFGEYYVEIEVGGCTSRSQPVTVQQKSDAGFEVNIEAPAIRVRLPRETIELTITHNSSSATIMWLKDGVPLPASNSLQLNAVEEGVYCAVVVDNSSSCPVSKKSAEYTVLDVTEIVPTIRPGAGYADCNNEETILSIVGIKGKATDGNEYDLTSDQIDSLTFQWFKDGAQVAGATNEQLTIDSYNDNGSYYLNAIISATMSADSNMIGVLLTVTGVEIMSSSVSNTLCPGGTITFNLDLVTGFIYKWFKDGTEFTVADPGNVEITEVGVYNVTFEGFGCLNNVEQIEVIEFDATVLEVSPSSTAVLTPGEIVRFEATGADSYEWYNEAGDLLSSNEILEIDVLGTYTLVGLVDTCRAEIEVNVVEDDGKLIIPNIITPFNEDGANDTWELPNRFAFQTDVQVIIYNSRGKEVLNTTDYQNNWPVDNNLKDGMLFYFKVIKSDNLIKAGTISILQ